MQAAVVIAPCRRRPHAAERLGVLPQLLLPIGECLRPCAHVLADLFENTGHTGILLCDQPARLFTAPRILPTLIQRVHPLVDCEDKIRKPQALRRKMSGKIRRGHMSCVQELAGYRVQRPHSCELVPLPADLPRTAPAADPVRRPIEYRP